MYEFIYRLTVCRLFSVLMAWSTMALPTMVRRLRAYRPRPAAASSTVSEPAMSSSSLNEALKRRVTLEKRGPALSSSVMAQRSQWSHYVTQSHFSFICHDSDYIDVVLIAARLNLSRHRSCVFSSSGQYQERQICVLKLSIPLILRIGSL